MKKLIFSIIVLSLPIILPLYAQDKPYRLLNSFSGGKLGELLNPREDLSKYHSGCSVMENVFPLPQGGAQKRPGTVYVAESKNNTKIRLIPFEYSTEQSYIIELGNQYMRFFTDNAPVNANTVTQDLSSITANLVAHYLCDEISGVRIDENEGTTAFDGTASADVSAYTVADAASTANEAFDLRGTYSITISGVDSMNFGNGTDDQPFSLHAWVYHSVSGIRQNIITRHETENNNREWALYINSDEQVVMELCDESADISINARTNDTLSNNTWYFVVMTYSGTGGASAADGIKIYVDWVEQDLTVTNDASYVAMEYLGADVLIGASSTAGQAMITQAEGTAIGDMTSAGGLAAAFDGDQTEANANCATNTGATVCYIGKDWDSGITRVISGFKAWGSSDQGFQNIDNANITITLQGSSDNFNVVSVDLGSSVAIADSAGLEISVVSGLTTSTAYRYHRLKISQDGASRAMFCAEAEFYGAMPWQGKMDNVAVISKELTSSEVIALTTASTTAYEVDAPYLTADLFKLKYEQSADVLYIVHPSYETRKLSRLANAIWSLDVFDAQTGPFRDQNINEAATITASAISGSVTLTASGHAPFVSGTTAGHLPSGSTATSKSQTGALFKIVHPMEDLSVVSSFINANDTMDCGTVYKGSTWYFVTDGTWRGKVEVQRNYNIGAAWNAAGWEKVFTFISGTSSGTGDTRNVDTNGTEDYGDADYQVIFTTDWTGILDVHFRTNQTQHEGIVEITAVASTTSATGTVVKTLGSTDATHKWSEGAWSNYRGWPRTATFFEDRLCFGGNASQPDTIWASVTADYENVLEGADDDDALNFTLSSRQVNVIEWMIGKDKILIGTSGAEWILAGSADEPLTPDNVRAEQQSTFGSANLQAVEAGESVLFFQRGAEMMRELAYNWEIDSYVAPDMTILVPEITGDGITDTAFQQTPNSILWCVKENGDMATFVYERKELITSWSEMITDDDFESVAVINGTSEDQVWVSVKRTIGGSDKRYIEYFALRDWGSDDEDAFFVDSGFTYDSDNATTTISGLDHLEAETVLVYGDGSARTSQVVSLGIITVPSINKAQVGLPYTVQMRTMPLSWLGDQTIQGRIKRINEVIARYYKAGDFSVGRDAIDTETVSISGIDTSEDRATFPPGFDRPGYVFVYQQSPEPLTLTALMIEFQIF